MANDRWRNDQGRDEDRRRDEGDAGDFRSDGRQGRGSDDRGDHTIARRGFGHERSGYDRGGDGYEGFAGPRDRSGAGGSSGGYRGGGLSGERDRRGYSGGAYGSESYDRSYQDLDRSAAGGEDRGGGPGRSGAGRGFGGNDYASGFYGADQGHGGDRRRDLGGERGFWDRASDEVSSWFGDEEARRRRHMDERPGGPYRGRGPRNYVRSDERIRDDINDRLTDDPDVDASDVEVAVRDREVTLSGTVDSRFEKRRAEDIAESVSGVTHVQNNLRVGRNSGAVGPIGAAGSTTTGVSIEAGMPTRAAGASLSGGQSGASLASSTGLSGTGAPAASETGSRGTGPGGAEAGPQESGSGSAGRGRGRRPGGRS